MTLDALKQAARDYLRELERDDGNKKCADKAKERLAEVAVLWAQTEAIANSGGKKST